MKILLLAIFTSSVFASCLDIDTKNIKNNKLAQKVQQLESSKFIAIDRGNYDSFAELNEEITKIKSKVSQEVSELNVKLKEYEEDKESVMNTGAYQDYAFYSEKVETIESQIYQLMQVLCL